jgi:hypothetical protein
MKPQRLIAILLCFVLSMHMLASAQDMDSAIAKLTEDVATRISDSGNKKVTVLDFTDLQGNANELGRYVAEELTVDFVMSKRSFSVLDRANLKRILAEHKLTASGLIDPATAKQFGQLAGVDAMIFGTIVPVGDTIKRRRHNQSFREVHHHRHRCNRWRRQNGIQIRCRRPEAYGKPHQGRCRNRRKPKRRPGCSAIGAGHRQTIWQSQCCC